MFGIATKKMNLIKAIINLSDRENERVNDRQMTGPIQEQHVDRLLAAGKLETNTLS